MSDAEVREASVFRVGDRLVDAWGNDVDEDPDEGTDKAYEDMSAKELGRALTKRNEGRPEEDQIVIDGKVTKQKVIDALREDDEANEGESGE